MKANIDKNCSGLYYNYYVFEQNSLILLRYNLLERSKLCYMLCQDKHISFKFLFHSVLYFSMNARSKLDTKINGNAF